MQDNQSTSTANEEQEVQERLSKYEAVFFGLV